jgi:alkanesulfonate monooxygenase SsuD/methylene tetrahydromethanopterin reductase-like flavin-dependent oxidoreductase (luciferase family)
VAVPGRPLLPNGASRPRILVGGGGTPRSMRIAARFADEFNLSSSSPDVARTKYGLLAAACEQAGRDPGTITRSTMSGVLIGRNREELRARQQQLLRDFGNVDAGEDWFHERRDRWVFGTPDEARAQVERYAEAGAERIMLQDFLPRDLDMVDLMAETLFGVSACAPDDVPRARAATKVRSLAVLAGAFQASAHPRRTQSGIADLP